MHKAGRILSGPFVKQIHDGVFNSDQIANREAIIRDEGTENTLKNICSATHLVFDSSSPLFINPNVILLP